MHPLFFMLSNWSICLCRHSLREVLDAPNVMNMIKDTKAAQEVMMRNLIMGVELSSFFCSFSAFSFLPLMIRWFNIILIFLLYNYWINLVIIVSLQFRFELWRISLTCFQMSGSFLEYHFLSLYQTFYIIRDFDCMKLDIMGMYW